MDFKFRAVDGRPPTHLSSSIIASYPNPNTDPLHNARLMLQREMEKERIRQEIIAEEMEGRRVLEAEVRRELMMEREMGAYLSFEERLTMLLDPRRSFRFTNRLGNRLFESEALVSPNVQPDTENNKHKLIVLAKPDPNLCGAKRKAAMPPVAGELPCAGLKKKPEEEWSCALCQVSATSERALTEHLQGKKHKANEARLKAHNSSVLPLQKKTTKASKITTNGVGTEVEAKVEEDYLVNKINNHTDKETRNTEDTGNENSKLPVLEDESGKRLKKNRTRKEQREERTTELKTKFKFWCEMCEVGAFSAVVMKDHKEGKKHLARLWELNQNGEAVQSYAILASSKAGEEAKNKETMAEKANEKIVESASTNEKTREIDADNGKIIENVIPD